jgi:hypothetical protein
MRDDLALAAYAVHIGYTITAKSFDNQGIPHDDLQEAGELESWKTIGIARPRQISFSKN